VDSGEFDFGSFEAPTKQEGIKLIELEEEDEEEVPDSLAYRPEAEVFLQRETGEHKCTSCGYCYNPWFGEGDYGPGTKFADLPDNWRCPQCRVSKDTFVAEMEGVAGFLEVEEEVERRGSTIGSRAPEVAASIL